MSTSTRTEVSGELLEIARGVATRAGKGEQVEAYVVRSRETEVEVCGGEVESLTTAVVEGIGALATWAPGPIASQPGYLRPRVGVWSRR